MNVKYRLYFRTLRFVAFNWWLPFFIGVAATLIIEASFAIELAEAIVQICQQSLNQPALGQ